LTVPAAVIVGGTNPTAFQPTSFATTARALVFPATTKQEIQRHHRQNVHTKMVFERCVFAFRQLQLCECSLILYSLAANITEEAYAINVYVTSTAAIAIAAPERALRFN
jgi:hypothetical protein